MALLAPGPPLLHVSGRTFTIKALSPHAAAAVTAQTMQAGRRPCTQSSAPTLKGRRGTPRARVRRSQ